MLGEGFSLSSSHMSFSEAGLEIRTFPFRSTFREALPPGSEYQRLSSFLKALLSYYFARTDGATTRVVGNLEIADSQVEENSQFRYPLVLPAGEDRASSVVFLLHGLNERGWDKYLPWAARLAADTGSGVLLFPLPFHMCRAPAAWASPRLMHQVARERAGLFPDVLCSSFANAAISTRLQLVPERLCLSGLQALSDIGSLACAIRDGCHPSIDPAARMDIFGYSIGGLVGEILLLAGPTRAFAGSRLLLFCGGAALDLTDPVSRLILDSEAHRAIQGFYGPGFEARAAENALLHHALSRHEPEAEAFSLLMSSKAKARERAARLEALGARVMSITLARDTVMPPAGVLATLHEEALPRPALDMVLDFPFQYSHEVPFPLRSARQGYVDAAFDRVFDLAAGFFGPPITRAA